MQGKFAKITKIFKTKLRIICILKTNFWPEHICCLCAYKNFLMKQNLCFHVLRIILIILLPEKWMYRFLCDTFAVVDFSEDFSQIIDTCVFCRWEIERFTAKLSQVMFCSVFNIDVLLVFCLKCYRWRTFFFNIVFWALRRRLKNSDLNF